MSSNVEECNVDPLPTPLYFPFSLLLPPPSSFFLLLPKIIAFLLSEVEHSKPARTFLAKYIVDNVDLLPPYANIGRILTDASDERIVFKFAHIDELYKRFLDFKASKEMEEVTNAFDNSLSNFQKLYSSFKDVDSFKLAWTTTEPEAKKFLEATDKFHFSQSIYLPQLVNAMALDSRMAIVKAVKSKREEITAIRAAGPVIIDPRAAKKAAKAAEKARLLAEAEENDGTVKNGSSKKSIKKAAKKDTETDNVNPAASTGTDILDSIIPRKGKAQKKMDIESVLASNITAPPSPALSASATSPTFLPASPHMINKSDGTADPEVFHL